MRSTRAVFGFLNGILILFTSSLAYASAPADQQKGSFLGIDRELAAFENEASEFVQIDLSDLVDPVGGEPQLAAPEHSPSGAASLGWPENRRPTAEQLEQLEISALKRQILADGTAPFSKWRAASKLALIGTSIQLRLAEAEMIEAAARKSVRQSHLLQLNAKIKQHQRQKSELEASWQYFESVAKEAAAIAEAVVGQVADQDAEEFKLARRKAYHAEIFMLNRGMKVVLARVAAEPLQLIALHKVRVLHEQMQVIEKSLAYFNAIRKREDKILFNEEVPYSRKQGEGLNAALAAVEYGEASLLRLREEKKRDACLIRNRLCEKEKPVVK